MKVKPLEILDGYLMEMNPLRGLTLQGALGMLEDGERGYYSELMWAFRYVEKRDAMLRAAKQRLGAAVGKLDWDIRTVSRVPKGKELVAAAQAGVLREAYERIDNLEEAKKAMVVAQFRGFSHLEKHYDRMGRVTHLEPVPQWHWVRTGRNGPWEFNADARMGVRTGQKVRAENFIIREIEDPIDEIALLAYVDKELAKSGWSRAVKRHGLPFVFWVMSETVAATVANDPVKLAAWQEVMAQVCNDATGMFPGGDIKMLDISSNGGDLPHKDRIASLNEEIVVAATSGKLTMLNEATGLGSGNADAHADTFADIAQDLAKEISEVFQMQFDRVLLDEVFPGEPRLAYFELAAQDAEDVEAFIGNVKTLGEVGFKVAAKQVAEKTGYEIEELEKSEKVPGVAVQRAAGVKLERIELAAAAAAEDFRPLRKMLEDLLAVEDDEEFKKAAAAARDRLPGIYRAMLEDAGALADELGAAARDAMRENL